MKLVGPVKNMLWETFGLQKVTFYDQSKQPLWSAVIDDVWGPVGTQQTTFVAGYNAQTWNKNGSPRKGSATRKGKTQIFPGYYYSYGLTPEGVTPQPEADEAVLTQAQVDAKLKEYVTRRLGELSYYRDNRNLPLSKSNVEDWHLGEAFVTIFKELTE